MRSALFDGDMIVEADRGSPKSQPRGLLQGRILDWILSEDHTSEIIRVLDVRHRPQALEAGRTALALARAEETTTKANLIDATPPEHSPKEPTRNTCICRATPSLFFNDFICGNSQQLSNCQLTSRILAFILEGDSVS
jgi:hypothetical protein